MKSKLYRWVFWPLWFIVIPLALAILCVSLLAPGEHSIPTGGFIGWLRNFAQTQKVPAVIVFFTFFEMVVYQLRHHLPFADKLGALGREGLPKEKRRDYEHASHLLEEAQRTLRREKKDIAKKLKEEERQALTDALNELAEAMQAQPFDAQRFDQAHEAAHEATENYLSPWRRSEIREYSESILIAVAVALLLRAFVVEAFQIPSGSMLPTLQIKDHIFVNKFTYGIDLPFSHKRLFPDLPPERGDVLVFEYPDPNPRNDRVDYIKRAIALPGDTLLVRGGHPIINGWEVPHCRVGDYTFGGAFGTPQDAELFVEFLGDESYLTMFQKGRQQLREGPYRVQEGEFWVLGDNRDNSSDSRAWHHGHGAGVPFKNVKGRAMFVWLSFNNRGVDPLGITWDRLFTDVMGKPRLPKEARESLKRGIEECLEARPADTTPPPPSGR